jgi:hypothetical protein
MMRAAAALAAAGTIVVGASACQTTQELSAKIGAKIGHQSAIAGTTRLGALNRSVRVERIALLTSSGQTAVALALTNTSASAQAAFPVLIDVRDAGGRTVYRNDTHGIEPSIQQLALLAPHATAWWVDNEVLASGGVPKSVSAQLGAPTATAPASVPEITAKDVSASDSFPGPHISLTVDNSSSVAQTQLPVYVVALRAGAVVGAGRGIVPALAPGHSAALSVPMVGAVDKSTISVTIAPAGGR